MGTNAEDIYKAKKYFDQGNYSEALVRFQSILKVANNKSEQGQMRALIAASLVNSGQADDLALSIKMYKAIVNDFTLLPLWRAMAFADIATIIAPRSISFYQSNFSEEPYSGFLPDNGNDTSKIATAYSKLLMLSDEIYPTSYAEYRLAGYYSGILQRANFASTPETIAAAECAQRYVAEGDTRKDSRLFPPTVILQNYLERALGLSGGSIVLKNRTVIERDIAYQLIFSTAEMLHQDSLTGPSARTLLIARFYYANFIRSNSPDQMEKIHELLKPYEQLDLGPPTPLMFKNIGSPTTTFIKESAVALASMSPEFKGFLARAGLPLG